MTNKQLLDIALTQSAIDMNCCAQDFLCQEGRVVLSAAHPDARSYLTLPFFLNLVSYGYNIVASAAPEFAPEAKRYIDKYPPEHCFETPNMHALDDALRPFGMRVCFMAEYFLPDVEALRERECGLETRILTSADFADLYRPEWGNALCEKRRHLDVLGIGAYDNGTLVGLAGCSADCEAMWQIGVDVLPEYRRRGVASALTSRLALEILARGKVPFYCAAWSNIRSVRNAIASGFRPAWAEMTAKSMGFIAGMNN
ncbi:MAG TPA: GNAT family N-acetyltransferase [Clostridia bacterium]|nr:GNAT family N-acetyltransferase [Clostridia bacterium]